MAEFPFTTAQFLLVFARYNHAVWPFQVTLFGLAIAALVIIAAKFEWGSRAVFGILSFYWVWMGVAYHILFFSSINPAAYLFGALFVAQAAVLFWYGVIKEAVGFRISRDGYSAAALVFIVYSLLVYPAIGTFAGHGFPRLPTFGLPCPTTIFTFGILLLADRKVPWYLVAIPLAWAFVGSFAAFSLGIPEDYGLLVAGVLGTVLVAVKNRKLPAPA